MTLEEAGDGDAFQNDVTIMDEDYQERIRQEDTEVVPRKMFIKKEDVETHGYTTRCPGFISIQRVTALQKHSDACRTRLEVEMARAEKANKAKKSGRIRGKEDGGS